MPLYPVINKNTGETKELSMTISEWEIFKEENPEWQRNWEMGVANIGEIGEMNDKLRTRHPSWGDVLKKVKKSGGSKSKMDTY
jgi:DNA-binding transcriptional regulator PaaX